MAIIQIKGFECERCRHKWCPKTINQQYPDRVEIPVICPKCKSPYWNKPKLKKPKKGSSGKQ